MWLDFFLILAQMIRKEYRTEKSLKIDKKKDPIRILENQCLENNIADKDEFQKIKETIEMQIENDAIGLMNKSFLTQILH